MKPVIHLALIIVLGLLAYSNTFEAPFHFDDVASIEKNPLIRDFGYFLEPSKAKDVPLEYEYVRTNLFPNRPVGYLSFAVNYALGGLDVTGYHIVNLSVHIINAILMYWLVLLTFRTPFMGRSSLREYDGAIAVFSAFIFVAHPVQTQAVTYIVQRFASLASLFYLFSLASYVRARLSESKVRGYAFYALSLVSAVLAMKTKEMAITLPLVVALYEFVFLRESPGRRIIYLAPIMATVLIIPLSMLDAGGTIGDLIGEASEATRLASSMPRLDYLFTEFSVVATYLRLLALPLNQNLDYDYPVFASMLEPRVYLSFLLLAAIFGLGIYLLIRSRRSEPALGFVSFGIFWFFVTLSVESSLIPIADVIFEHRVYLPSVGAISAAVTAVFLLSRRFGGGKAMTAAVTCLVLVTLVFSVSAYARNDIWTSKISLWEDVAKKSPGNWRGHFNLGNEYRIAGNAMKAIEELKIAIKLNPGYVDAHQNLGLSYKMMGMTDKALETYRQLLVLKPDHAEAYNNTGNIYLARGQLDSAVENYRTALRLKPDYVDAHYNLGIGYYYKGMMDEAISEYRVALSLKPGDAEIHNNLGAAYLKKGLAEMARREFETALRLDPGLREARESLRRIPGASGSIQNSVR